jgi:hypothetical protein
MSLRLARAFSSAGAIWRIFSSAATAFWCLLNFSAHRAATRWYSATLSEASGVASAWRVKIETRSPQRPCAS